MHDKSAIADAVRALFDVPVGVGVTDPRAASAPLMAGEAAHLAGAVAKRKLEFAAGRAAAREAMAALGMPLEAVLSSASRAPVWPEGVQGSISHSDQLCVAVVCPAGRVIGVDVEPAAPLEADLMAEVLGHPPDSCDLKDRLAATLVFSAKEAAFKAQYPLSKRMIGFDATTVTVEEMSFEVVFDQPAGPFARGDKLSGRHTLVAEHFVTAVSIDSHA
jgi:4'-phosphopantetheinyl transferase EntD